MRALGDAGRAVKLIHLIPAPLHRAGYRLAFRARRLWRGRVRSTSHGCTVVARDGEGRFLLVRHSYGPDVWTFPSGGIGKHETPLVAAVREFREELGCGLLEVRRISTYQGIYLRAPNVVHVFTGIVAGVPRADRREIVEARFFARDELPQALSRIVAPHLAAFDADRAGPPAWHKLQQR